MSSSTQTCVFWLKGQCSFGAQCKNAHGQLRDRAAASPSTAVCPHFLRGACKFGDQCRLPHTLPSSSAPRVGVRAPSSPVVNTAASNGARVCPHFVSGNCRFGSQCRLSHTMAIAAPSETWRTPATPQTTSKNPTTGGLSPALPVFGSCRFFQAGRCLREDCAFPHVANLSSPPSPQVTRQTTSQIAPAVGISTDAPVLLSSSYPVAPVASTENTTADTTANDLALEEERNMLGCRVAFGPGAAIERITTAFESPVITLSNIPTDASEETLLALLEAFGHLKSFLREGGKSTARVEYVDLRQAVTAVEGLYEHQLGGSTLSAQYELGAVQTGTALLRSTKVKLSFFAPAVMVYAHYDTISKARQEAARLDAKVFNGAVIRASCQTPTYRQRTSFSVSIKGMPVAAEADLGIQRHIEAFTHASDITVGHATYTMSSRTQAAIRGLLEAHGRLESFDIATNSKSKVVAWAQFASSDAALRAREQLHGKPQHFLGNSPVWVEQVHALRYALPNAQFSVLKDELDRYSATLEVSSKLRYYELDQNGAAAEPVVLRLYSADAQALAQAKGKLESLLQGDKLVDETGAVVWDDILAMAEGRVLFQEVQRTTHAYAECQARLRIVRLHGPSTARDAARNMILQWQDEVRKKRRVVTLERSVLRGLLSGGFRRMQSELGEDKLRLDVVRRTITIRGDDSDVFAVERIISDLGTTGAQLREPSVDLGDCPVCFCEVSQGGISLPCGHAYDTDCLRHLAQAAISPDFKPLMCVTETGSSNSRTACSTAIPLAQIRKLLDSNDEAQLLDASIRAYVNARPDEFHYCPTPDCPVVYRPARTGTVLRCPSCLLRVCAHCHVENHEGISCAKHKDSLRPHTALFARWKAENGVRSCPKCEADIQKNGGCNHIHCSICKTHICWKCMATFDDADRGGGVYSHMQQAHGGISN